MGRSACHPRVQRKQLIVMIYLLYLVFHRRGIQWMIHDCQAVLALLSIRGLKIELPE